MYSEHFRITRVEAEGGSPLRGGTAQSIMMVGAKLARPSRREIFYSTAFSPKMENYLNAHPPPKNHW